MDLINARNEIDNIDREIVSLLEKRFDVVLNIGQYKKENKIPIYDANREDMVVKTCISYLKNKDYAKSIEVIYKQIMNSSKELEL